MQQVSGGGWGHAEGKLMLVGTVWTKKLVVSGDSRATASQTECVRVTGPARVTYKREIRSCLRHKWPFTSS
jgi:hypothetical protein